MEENTLTADGFNQENKNIFWAASRERTYSNFTHQVTQALSTYENLTQAWISRGLHIGCAKNMLCEYDQYTVVPSLYATSNAISDELLVQRDGFVSSSFSASDLQRTSKVGGAKKWWFPRRKMNKYGNVHDCGRKYRCSSKQKLPKSKKKTIFTKKTLNAGARVNLLILTEKRNVLETKKMPPKGFHLTHVRLCRMPRDAVLERQFMVFFVYVRSSDLSSADCGCCITRVRTRVACMYRMYHMY